jgi:hypothetical protein
MLDLHLMQEHISVLGQLQLSTTGYQPENRGIRFSKKVAYIFRVPFGPRLVFITSCNPRAPLMFISSAAALRANSAFGFNTEIADIISELKDFNVSKYLGQKKRSTLHLLESSFSKANNCCLQHFSLLSFVQIKHLSSSITDRQRKLLGESRVQLRIVQIQIGLVGFFHEHRRHMNAAVFLDEVDQKLSVQTHDLLFETSKALIANLNG